MNVSEATDKNGPGVGQPPDEKVRFDIELSLNAALNADTRIMQPMNAEGGVVIADNLSRLTQSNAPELEITNEPLVEIAPDTEHHQFEEAPLDLSVRLRKDASNESGEGTPNEEREVRSIVGQGHAHNVNNSNSSRNDTPKFCERRKRYKCEWCSKSFDQIGNMQRHSRTHTGEMPFQCMVCGARFTQKGNMESHARTHTNEKPYNCEMCPRSFAHRCNLRNHLRIHTGEKPYSCTKCDKSFARSNALLNHLRLHNTGGAFQ